MLEIHCTTQILQSIKLRNNVCSLQREVKLAIAIKIREEISNIHWLLAFNLISQTATVSFVSMYQQSHKIRDIICHSLMLLPWPVLSPTPTPMFLTRLPKVGSRNSAIYKSNTLFDMDLNGSKKSRNVDTSLRTSLFTICSLELFCTRCRVLYTF